MPSRNVSSTLKEALNSQQTSECFGLLLEIDHADLASTIYVTNNGQTITSNGNDYVHLPFVIQLPDDLDDRVSRVELRIDNIDRSIVEAVRSISTEADVTLSVVLTSDPDTVEVGPFAFKLKNAQYNALIVTGELSFEDVLNDRWPKNSFDAANFPGLFAG